LHKTELHFNPNQWTMCQQTVPQALPRDWWMFRQGSPRFWCESSACSIDLEQWMSCSQPIPAASGCRFYYTLFNSFVIAIHSSVHQSYSSALYC
jgi:hypothetical protein